MLLKQTKSIMNYEEATKLYQLRLAQIHLSVIYEFEFLQRLGRRGLEEFRDNILDDIIELRKIIKNAQ